MNNKKSGPKLPGEDDSWESLATNLFGIDFSKPQIPAEEEIAFDLSTELGAKPAGETSEEPSSEEFPADEDVRLTEAGKAGFEEEYDPLAGFPEDVEDKVEAGFPDDDEDEVEAGFPDDDEDDAEFADQAPPRVVSRTEPADDDEEDEEFAEFDDETEQPLEAADAEDEEVEEVEEVEDTYWDTLNEFQWDAEEEPAETKSRESSRGRGAKPSRSRSRSRPEGRPEKPAPKRTSAEERTLVDDDDSSAADYYAEYEDGDFGSGLLEEAVRQDEAVDDVEVESPAAEVEEEEESSPDRKRRRRRRRRKPRGEASSKESERDATGSTEDISLDEMDFESEVDDVDEPVAKPAKEESRRRPSPPSRQKYEEEEPEEEEPEDSFSGDLADEDEDEDVEEEARPRRRKRSRSRRRDEDSGTDEETRSEAGRERKPARDKESVYRNIPTWEEAISYLVQPKRSRQKPPSKSEGDSGRSSGRRRRRRS